MIPQVAHKPPQLLQQFEAPRYATVPFGILPQARRPDGLEPPRIRKPRTPGISVGHSHRAYPIEIDDAYRRNDLHRSSATHSLVGHYNDPSEHMLRRKTPNGTLAAGYDGTPVQWSSKAPALKHVVHSAGADPSGQDDTYTPAVLKDLRIRQRSDSLGEKQTYQKACQTPRFTSTGRDLSTWTQFPLSSSHNFWDQIWTQQAPLYHPNIAIQIPTVLQPSYQPCPGPTASNDGGLYGPYWPDGRFIPYRPAAVKDHRGYQQKRVYLDREDHQQSLPQTEILPHIRQLSFSGDVNHSRNLRFGIPHNGVQLPENSYKSTSVSHANSCSPTFYRISNSPQIPMTHYSNSESNPWFKEKTLSWAHSIYTDLLAFIYHTKKDSRPVKQSHGFRFYAKDSIYPRPPRQPTAHLHFAHCAPFEGTESTGAIGQSDDGHKLAPSRTLTAANFNGCQGSNCLREPQFSGPISQENPHSTFHFQTSPQLLYSPLSKAREALEMLGTLCEQGGWSWIDGMLLGGCLAYGLEEYQKALEWYSKIIALDPQHVEAISNLAATLLCLDRREEAERYWLQSVKLRPSYFEAVEHLIGLLCGEHRGNEAVNILEFVERSLRLPMPAESSDNLSETSSNADRESCDSMGGSAETLAMEYDVESGGILGASTIEESDDYITQPGYGLSGFSVPGSENGRILALVHAKGNMLYALGDIDGASKAFEEAVLISTGRGFRSIQELIRNVVNVLSMDGIRLLRTDLISPSGAASPSPLLLPPDKALQTARLVFAQNGDPPGLRYVPNGLSKRAAISTTSNSLLSLAKIFQDAMSNSNSRQRISRMPTGVGDILALYYLSLSLQPSPSTANNVGILLASVQQPPSHRPLQPRDFSSQPTIPGVVPGSGVALALAYYNYGLNLDSRHAHIYTNLGSLLKDIGQLSAAITMYEKAVACDGSFDIALANLANAVKDQGRTSDAIEYYRRAVASSPDFAEAVCGLANALNSVCNWTGRGGVILDDGRQDRWHVDDIGMITDAKANRQGGGWMKRVVDIVAKQLKDGSTWGQGTLQEQTLPQLLQQLEASDSDTRWPAERRATMQATLNSWAGQCWEGARLMRLIERAIKRAMHRWYHDKYVRERQLPPTHYPRPQVPGNLTVPTAPTVLPFHTFTCPLSAKEIRMISQRNALRISCSTLKAPWLQVSVFSPPPPPAPHLNIGYVSSDFNNHPLAHLMQSVFGFHNPSRAKAFCYATTVSDNSVHRQQIEREAPVFRDVSMWPIDRIVHQIVRDEIHILVNLNGYTRGARNEVFAARPAPIQMSFMGFAGTLGAEWCDYILADKTAIPPDTLRPWRRNIDLEDQILDQEAYDAEDWVYSENIIFCRDTFFCCDHAQSEPREKQLSWEEEQSRRWEMRKELFPGLSDDAVILGNFNQLYKIEPTTFRTWLRILDKVPKAILWLLRFPDLGESNLKRTAQEWAGGNVASRIWFTDVAPKHQHISRARVCDLFLDTPECNAHTTAADVLWSSTPLLTLPRHKYKMCSRMAASILKGALPRGDEGRRAAEELIADDDVQYEEYAIRLASTFSYRVAPSGHGEGTGRLGELRKLLYDNRWTCALFDTRRWVSDLESGYVEAWRRWVADEGGDIFL
ncbi:hypothetical protein QTJ16_001105 [Diplocarpon rosae]|uniref:protein O-GlcNAc transferase n=1 Tax=Diplocarpon rosae TaxID=946125 RepID=A0AAD9WG86_9HELO|nr:hypothetical protein QTJ16_001105 [Diplocarpon rosae]PBP22748.1 UDP-N-acetylglucosaminyltransferase [Diplocarpon rosae]